MAEQKRTRKTKKYTFRGLELSQLCELKDDQLFELFDARARRKMARSRGLKGPYRKLVQRVAATTVGLIPGERPLTIKTHLRNALIFPQMVGGIVGIYNGREFKEVEIKFDMIGRYLAEFSITYKPTLRKAAFVHGKKKESEE